ncbi:MAG: hypothetical protein WC686_02405 [Candidatus Shapirobacteria bacterium]|jgi:hypothetical protein
MSKIILKRLIETTSRYGVYQHSHFCISDPKFGYAIDDQARALIIAKEVKNQRLRKIYEKFLYRAFKDGEPVFHYFYDSDKDLVPDKSIEISDDALAMVLWALKTGEGNNEKDKVIMDYIENRARTWEFPRSWSYALIGLTKDEVPSQLEIELKSKLVNLYNKNNREDWQWFENSLVYGNALMPWAMWELSIARDDKEAHKIATESTEFLIEAGQLEGVPLPIGNRGWYERGKEKAIYDQQPVEAAYMILCLEAAFKKTKDEHYREWAKKWWGWFWGNNTKKVKLIEKYACYDAITDNSDRVNLNQGAESIISFLLAWLAAKRLLIENN